MFAPNNTNHSNRANRKKANLLNKTLDQLSEGGMTASHEDRITRFATHKSENRYLEMKAKREELKNEYIRQGKMSDPNHVYQLDEAVPFVAECMDMCPEYEREEREYTNFLEPFEKIPGTDRVDHAKAVKRYKRSAAGDPPPLPCDVRPPKILFNTLDYLFHEIIGEHGVAASHSFVRDRARSIRNDLTLQSYSGIEAIILHERIARYHIMCSNLLCGSDGFVMQQEEEQIRKTVLSLMEFYSEMSAKGVVMTNEAEFQSYYILTLPWSNDVPSRLEKELSPSVFFDPQVQLAMKIRFLMSRREEPNRPSVDGSLNHYSKIFSIIRKDTTSYLLACCIHMHFRDIRKSAIRAIQKSYYYNEADPSSGLLLSEIIDSLGFDGESDAIAFLNHYFIDVGEGPNGKVAYVGRKVITDKNGKQKPGDYPKFPYTIVPDNIQLEKSELIEAKRKSISYIDILNGKYVSLDVKNGVSPVILTSPMKKTPVASQVKSPYTKHSIPFKPRVQPATVSAAEIDQPAAILTTRIASNGISAIGNLNGSTFSFKPFITPSPSTTPLFQPPQTDSKAIPIINPKNNMTIFPKSFDLNGQNGSITPGDFRSLSQSEKPPIKFQSATMEEVKIPATPPFQVTNIATPITNLKKQEVSKVTVPSSPQTIFSASNIPKNDSNQLALSLFDSIYFELVSLESNAILNDSLTLLQNELSNELYESVLYSIILETVKDRLDTHRKLYNWRFALQQVLDNITNEFCDAMSYDFVNETLEEAKLEYRRCIFVRDRWKFFILYLKYKRRKQELIGKKMVSYLRQSTFAPPIIDIFGPIAGKIDNNVLDKGDMVESKLADLAREMQEKRATWYRSIRLEAQVLPFIDPNRPLSPNYKFVLCTSGYNEKVTGSLGWFTDTWLQSKLSSQARNPKFLGDLILNPNNEPVILLDERFMYDGDEETRILLYHTDDSNLSVNSVQLHNADSKFSGCNAALFQCDYFSNSKYKTRRDYWNQLSLSLKKFAMSMPKFAKIPLLLIYWASPGLSETHFAEKFSSEISYLRSESPFITISVIYLHVSTDLFDSEEASTRLQKGMIWIFDNSTIPPTMNNRILSNCDNLSKSYEWAIRKLESLVSDPHVYHIPQLQCILAASMVNIHNRFMMRIIQILTDQACIQLAFPAVEFIEDTKMRDWNTLESMNMIQKAEAAFRLPPFPTSELTTNNLAQVVNMYIRYVDSLSFLPGMTLDDLDSLKSLILAPEFSSSRVWFSISNAIVRLFSSIVHIEERFYIVNTLKENAAVFERECQGIVSQFMRDETVATLFERNIPKFSVPTTSTSTDFANVETRKRKNKEEVNPLETLKKAMQKANLLLSSIQEPKSSQQG